MIRKEVEKLRGFLFTKEEMDEIINPILNDSRNGKYVDESKQKKRLDYVTSMLLKQCYEKYYVLKDEYQKGAKLYSILADMGKSNPDKLVDLWYKVSRTGILVCPEDIDKELLDAFYIGAYFKVYNEAYKVSWETSKDANTVVFERV